jgi:hypothetical protein
VGAVSKDHVAEVRVGVQAAQVRLEHVGENVLRFRDVACVCQIAGFEERVPAGIAVVVHGYELEGLADDVHVERQILRPVG